MFGMDAHVTSTSNLGFARFPSEVVFEKQFCPLVGRRAQSFTLKHGETDRLVVFEHIM